MLARAERKTEVGPVLRPTGIRSPSLGVEDWCLNSLGQGEFVRDEETDMARVSNCRVRI